MIQKWDGPRVEADKTLIFLRTLAYRNENTYELDIDALFRFENLCILHTFIIYINFFQNWKNVCATNNVYHRELSGSIFWNCYNNVLLEYNNNNTICSVYYKLSGWYWISTYEYLYITSIEWHSHSNQLVAQLTMMHNSYWTVNSEHWTRYPIDSVSWFKHCTYI